MLVSSALTVHYTFSSFLVVARRHYRYIGVSECQSVVAQAATDVLEVSNKARQTQVTSEIEGTLLAA